MEPEAFRQVALVVSGLVVLLAAVVVVLYLVRWARTEPGAPMGLLPAHVWAVASSYLVYVVASAVEMHDRLERAALSWRTPIYLTAALVGLVALSLLLVHEVRALRKPTDRPHGAP